MGINRRDVLRFAAGSGLGVAFTPIPWKLLDDSAIWTQNWCLTPKLPRGEVATRFSTCTLCPAGCGVKARCVAGVPFSVTGVTGHPNSNGALCAAGIDGHHIAYRQDRLRTVVYRGKPSKLERALDAIRSARGPVAILDLRPHRAVSDAYRKVASQVAGAVYIEPRRAGATLDALRDVTAGEADLGVDLEQTKTLLSFGAPVLDGWAAPGRVWAARAGFRLIQADAVNSRTAMLADAWLPLRPGSEAALALAIGHVLLRDGLAHKDATRAADFAAYQSLTARFTPEYASGITGLPADKIVATAREFAGRAPAVAIGGGDPVGGPLGAEEEIAIAGLNLLAGSAGRTGGLLARRQSNEPTPGKRLADIADGSLGVLIVDAANASEAIAWNVVKRKLAPGAVVIAHAAFRTGLASHADFVVPAPAYLESLEDAPAPFDAPRASLAIAPALLTKPAEAMDSAEFLAALAPALGVAAPGSMEEILKQKAAAVHGTKRGTVFSYATAQSKPLAEFKTADELWTALNEGGCWVDENPAEAAPKGFRLLGSGPDAAERLARAGEGLKRDGDFPLALIARGGQGAAGDASLAPLMTKVYQESRLRPDSLLLHPETAKACGLEDGCNAVVETRGGSASARVKVAPGTLPGTVEAEIGPRLAGLIEICSAGGCTWRGTAARIRRA